MKAILQPLLGFYANNPFTEKASLKRQWRILKFLFVAASGVLFAYAPDERAFLLWGVCFVSALCFSLAINKNPIIAILGLIFSPVTVFVTILWWGGKRFISGLISLTTLKAAFIINSPNFTSLRALFVSLFFAGVA